MNSNSSINNGGIRCQACKYLRRRCSENCTLAPYFQPSQPKRFACVHRIFGASNISRMLQHLPEHERAQAADAMALEAYWRVEDPVYGCSSRIVSLLDEISKTQNELALTRAQISIQQDLLQQQQRQVQPNQPAHEHHNVVCWAIENDSLLLPDIPYMPPHFLGDEI